MTVKNQIVKDRYAIYNADCIEVLRDLPKESIGLSVYSPPFAGLYQYSSDERDLSNSASRDEFFAHYDFVIKEMARITMPGRMTCVHCSDIPSGNSGVDTLFDLPGEFIRRYEAQGFKYTGRRMIWNEPLRVRNRTQQKNLMHVNLTEDATSSGIASADYILFMRKGGENRKPVEYPRGLVDYYGENKVPAELAPYRGWAGSHLENKYSHWIWRQYASSHWMDIRTHNILPFQGSKENDDEKHVHPLQLDVIARCVQLHSNPDETVLTPFMGVGSEVYQSVLMGRRAIGVELKNSYYRQAVKNVAAGAAGIKTVAETDDLLTAR